MKLERNYKVEALAYLNSQPSRPLARRASVAGGNLFSVNNKIQETGSDHLPKIQRSKQVCIDATDSTATSAATAATTFSIRVASTDSSVPAVPSPTNVLQNDETNMANMLSFATIAESAAQDSRNNEIGQIDTSTPAFQSFQRIHLSHALNFEVSLASDSSDAYVDKNFM